MSTLLPTTPLDAPARVESTPPPASVLRTVLGGVLMGFANLVPGISGGTMILAIGLYERFIGSIADLARLRFTRANITFLALIGAGAAGSIVVLSGVLVDLVTNHRWIMYSLFVGMTLGGVPELARASRPLSTPVVVAFVGGLATMVAVAFLLQGAELPETAPVFVAVGALAASSMILPGISGSYLLLIFGMYELVIGSLRVGALREDFAGSLRVIVPVGIGAVLGVGLLSNLLKYLLARYSRAAHGALLGLLVGSVLGLWPFQEPVDPDLAARPTRKAVASLLAGESGESIRAAAGPEFDDARLAEFATRYAGMSESDLKRRGDELQRFRPAGRHIGGSLGLFVLGFAITRIVSRREARA